ncbi:MAG: hypothetical protein LBD02_04290 [Christensenellaceae bacterium]|nr:hypothetical protein [Christensenellaceae bacterium]
MGNDRSEQPWLPQTLAFGISAGLICGLYALRLNYNAPFVEWVRAQPKEFSYAISPILLTFSLQFLLSAAQGAFFPLLRLFGRSESEKLRLNWPWIVFFR